MKNSHIYHTGIIRTLAVIINCLFILNGAFLHAQSFTPIQKVKKAESDAVIFESVAPFSSSTVEHDLAAELEKKVGEYDILEFDKKSISQLAEQAPEALEMTIPSQAKDRNYRLKLVKANPFTDDFKLTRASDNSLVGMDQGIHYYGYIEDDVSSLVAISFFKEEVIGIISGKDGNRVMGRLDANDGNGKHIFYDDNDLWDAFEFECNTPNETKAYKRYQLERDPASKEVVECVRFYLEVDYDIYLSKGGMAGTYRFITGLMHQVRSMFDMSNISTAISEIKIWDVPSPYYATHAGAMLDAFQAQVGQFNGDAAQLLSYKAMGGIASQINAICDPDPDKLMSYSSLPSFYTEFPHYSIATYIVAHEFGHTLGSSHTNACIWNGNGTALDGCNGTEGSCPLPPRPQEGSTVMSTGCFKNFSFGFGIQPGNLINNRLAAKNCLTACNPPSCNDNIQNGNETGVDCGGSCDPCASCNDGIRNGDETEIDCGGTVCPPCFCEGEDVILTITLDDASQTSWAIKFGDVVYAAGGRYYGDAGYILNGEILSTDIIKVDDNDTLVQQFCLDYGCYDLIVMDGNGNGLDGYYLLQTTLGDTLAFSGQFTWSDSTRFCLNGPSQPFTVEVIEMMNESCPGNADGMATALAGWGRAPFSYNWSNGANTKTITGLTPGTYTVTATDQNGNTDTASVVIGTDFGPGDSCDDGDPCTENDIYDSNCNCAGVIVDSDGDGICDAEDKCPGGDDLLDNDGDGIPNDCDADHCVPTSINFQDNPLTHNGPDYSYTELNFSPTVYGVQFTISDIDAKTKGRPSDRYNDRVAIYYANSNELWRKYSDVYGDEFNSINVHIYVYDISSIRVYLSDAYDGNANGLSITMSSVSYCDIGGTCPDSDNDGTCDANDLCPGFDDALDNDGDGVPDGCDLCNGYDDSIDSDGDGVPNGCDICNGFDDTIDSDGDGVPDGCDLCAGYDDTLDGDGDGVPDSCDVCPGIPDNSPQCTGNCKTETHEFPDTVLTSDGSPNSTTLLFANDPREEVSFTITDLNAKTNGNPNGRFIDLVTVTYEDAMGVNQNYGTFSGENVSSVDVILPEPATSVTVTLEDDWDGNAPQTLQVDLGTVTSCIPPQALSTAPAYKELVLIDLYPNPANLQLNLEFELTEPHEFDILIRSVDGQILQINKMHEKVGFHQSTIPLIELPTGLYLLELITKDQRIIRRFVVLR